MLQAATILCDLKPGARREPLTRHELELVVRGRRVRVNPLSQIKSLFPILKNPANRKRAVGFTPEGSIRRSPTR